MGKSVRSACKLHALVVTYFRHAALFAGSALLFGLANDSAAANPSASPLRSELQAENWPAVQWPLALNPAHEKAIDSLLTKMSVADKVGQIVQADIDSVTPAEASKYRLGSVLAGGNSDPGKKYNAAPKLWLELADAFYDASIDTANGKQAIPILFGIDAVHGQSNIVGATLFPHNIGLGATRNVELMRKIGAITAIETRVTGMEWAFAPTVAVPQDDRWGRAYEGFSESPQLVASYSAAIVEGLQGRANSAEFLDGAHVMASVKHFVGDGGTLNGKDQGDTAIDEANLARVHGAGYPPAIAAGAQSVMASFNSFNGEKLHGHRHLLTDVLKGRMNFGGFVVGDWNGHGQVQGCTSENCAASFNAGVDMFMAPDTWKPLLQNTIRSVQSGEIKMPQLNASVRRILRVKMRLGLFNAGRPSKRLLGGQFDQLGSPAHRAVARQAVRESLVLIKNSGAILPLDPRKNILVAGDGANDVGKQAGGWTLNWQGTGTKRADFPNASTIFEGIARQVSAAGGTTTLSITGEFQTKPDVAVVVFGENPYAEFQGDVQNLLYQPGVEADLKLIRSLKARGVPVIAVFLSGRPLWMNREINASDAFVAAWLPGSEGEGIADVLFRSADGSIQHDFKGKLSFSWPRTAIQFQNNIGQPNYDPLFAFGYGLRYADSGELAELSESSGITAASALPGLYFSAGSAAVGLQAQIENAAGEVGVLTHQSFGSAFGGPEMGMHIESVDYQAQEDARQLRWIGKRARFSLQSDAPIDLSRETNGDVLLVLTLRVDTSARAELLIACDAQCKAQLPLRAALMKLPPKQWRRLGIPLKCLAAAGANPEKLQSPFWIEGTQGWGISLSRVALGALNESDHVLSCKNG
jgi:beta-glucosidase